MSDGRVQARFSSANLLNNFEVISRLVPRLKLLPMIKANGYGHGATWVAQTLIRENFSALAGFGVATLGEGLEIRKALPRFRGTLLVLAGGAEWNSERSQIVKNAKLTPVFFKLEDLKNFLVLTRRRDQPLSFHLKFNTGMNRLGIDPSEFDECLTLLRKAALLPTGILSHLAVAENPNHPVSRKQLKNIRSLFEAFSTLAADLSKPNPIFHFGNSSAIWNHRPWELEPLSNWARPGISLYGVPPWSAATIHGLKPVLTLDAPILQSRKLAAGDAVGYGAHFSAQKNSAIVAGTLAIGYGDGLPRQLWKNGSALIPPNTRKKFLGIISMDLSSIDLTGCRKQPKRVRLLGEGIDPWKQAEAAGTIPYQLFTALSSRVERIYE